MLALVDGFVPIKEDYKIIVNIKDRKNMGWGEWGRPSLFLHYAKENIP